MNPYALMDVFTFDEAVQAITGIIQPRTTEEKNAAKLVGNALRGDIDFGKLIATTTEVQRVRQERIGMRHISINDTRDHRPILEHPYAETIIRIARADLLAWCESRGIRPPFLFPDPPPGSDAPELTPKAEGSVLWLLAAVLSMVYGKNWANEDPKTFLAELKQDLQGKGIQSPKDDRTWIGHLKRAALKMEGIFSDK